MDARTLCLAALNLGEASGYEIKKLLEAPPFSHFQDTGFGSIYPALSKLAQEGLIEGTTRSQEKRPDKKVYRLTDAGRLELAEALLKPPAEDKFRSDFCFVMFMADLVPAEHLRQMLDERLKHVEQELQRMEQIAHHLTSRGQKFVCDLGQRYYRMLRDHLQEHRAWAEEEKQKRQAAE